MPRKSLWIALIGVGGLLLIPDLAHAADSKFAEAMEKGIVWAYLFAFGAGFLTSLTPCVYPMIPITVAVFGARDDDVNRRKAFVLASCYILGIAILYSVLGTAFAMAGKGSAGELLGNPWVIVPIVLVFIALAMSMFGAFELQLPMGLQSRLNSIGGKGYAGAFAMGLVGGLIAAPCTGPPLAAMLLWVGTTQDAVAGSTLLFTYAIGMGVLFWVIAVFAVSLPRSGRWMEGVKSFFGIVMLVAAAYFARPVIPALGAAEPGSTFLIASLVVAGVGLALGAVHLSFHAGWSVRIRKGFGVTLAVVGLIGALNSIATPDRHLAWRTDEAQAFTEARSQGKHVMIDFGAEWCAPCKQIEVIMGSSEVYDAIVDHYVPLKFDVTKQTELEEALQDKYDADTLPAVIFLTAGGTEIGRYNDKSPTTEGFLDTIRDVTTKNPPGGAVGRETASHP